MEGLPHHICDSCQDTLKKAIEFRENCIKANVKLNQGGEKESKYGFQIFDDEMESELENVLYEESSQHISKASEIGFSDLDFDLDSEDDTPLVDEESSPIEDVLPVEESEKKTSREHVCREIASIIKCETKEEIGKVNSKAEVYKVVLSECNREEETKPTERTKKPFKYSLAVPKPKKPKLSSEEKSKFAAQDIRQSHSVMSATSAGTLSACQTSCRCIYSVTTRLRTLPAQSARKSSTIPICGTCICGSGTEGRSLGPAITATSRSLMAPAARSTRGK